MDDRAKLVGVLERAREGGARAAEVLRASRSALEQTGARVPAERHEETEWTVRVWLEGGRAGMGVGGSVGEALERAQVAAASAPRNPLAGPAERMAIRAGALGIDDHRHPNITEADRVEILQAAERAFASGGVRTRALRYRQWREERAWMSTRGVEAAEASTTYELLGTTVAGDVEVGHRIASRHFSDVASLPFGAELRRRLESLTRAVARPSAPLPLVLEPRVTADLVRALAGAFVSAGTFVSALGGRRLAAATFHLTDDAGLFGGLQTRAFDDRGVPPIPVALLKEGVVSGFFHDPESARALGLRPTGHLRRGRLSPSNLVVRPGARTRNVLLADLGTHLVLDRLPTIDLEAGRLRGTAPLVLVERGERSGAFPGHFDVSIADLLGAVAEVAADQERSCEVDAPTAVLVGVPLG